jgi:hypothetical protein
MPVNLIRDADIQRIAIVDKGANRKRFFLFKAEGDREVEQLGSGRILKADDWSAVYCVVAEPGWHESPGIGAEAPDIEDRWASEDEIRKAAHRFMKNGGLLNKMHESLDPYGDLVENAIALDDFEVGGQTIRKGSWYIAFEPNSEGRDQIEKGIFGGVSIEGVAIRELVEKRKGSTPGNRSVGSVAEETLLQKIAKKVGLTGADLMEKSDRTFGEIVAQREFDEALPLAFDAFRDAVWGAFFPVDKESADPKYLISESCDEFKAWALEMLDTAPIEKGEREEALAKAFGSAPDGSTPHTPTFGEDTMTDETKERFEKLEKAQADTAEAISKLADGVGEIAKAVKTEPEAPTVESVNESVADLAKSLDGLKADIAKLGEGGSSQNDPAAPVAKDKDAEAVAKAFEKQGVSSALAGVLG